MASAQSGYAHPFIQDVGHTILVCRFTVDANDWLGATEADEQPAAIFHEELEAINGDDVGAF